MRQALSPQPGKSRRALTELIGRAEPPPAAFAPHLISFSLSLTNSSVISLCIALLKRIVNESTQHSASEKLKSTASTLRKTIPTTRRASVAAKLACALLGHSSTSSAALDLLIAALVALERSPVPSGGSQTRSKRKAQASLYFHTVRSVALEIIKFKDSLFSTGDGFAKSPDEAVAAVSLLASCQSFLTDAERTRLIVLICTICMKLPRRAKHVIRITRGTFESVSPSDIIAKVVPMVERSLIREPQTAITSASCLLRALAPLDLSPIAAKSLIPAVVQSLKSSEDEIRRDAVLLAGAIGSCVSDEAALLKCATELAAVLKVSRYVYQRISTFDALSALTECAPLHGKVTDIVVSSIHTWLSSKKETREEARKSGLRALVRLLASTFKSEDANIKSLTSLQPCTAFLSDILCGKLSESDHHALLSVLTESHPSNLVPEDRLGDTIRPALSSVITSSASKPNKHELVLHALTLLCDWTSTNALSAEGSLEKHMPTKVSSVLNDPSISPALGLPSSFTSANDALCAVRTCVFIVRAGLDSSEHALASLYRLCLDDRREVCAASQKAIQTLQNNADTSIRSKMFLVLWRTQFSGVNARSTVAKNYNFDDGMVFAERLGHTLLCTVLPNLSDEDIPLILLAANHPRLCPEARHASARINSRFWLTIARKLGSVDCDYTTADASDWLDKCVKGIFGEQGLQNSDDVVARSALNSLAVLADEQNPYSVRAIRQSILLLDPIALGTSRLPPHAFDALKIVEADQALRRAMDDGEVESGVTTKKPSKKSAANLRQSSQEKQAHVDRARAAAATASAAAEKVEKAQELANSTASALRHSKNALLAIASLGYVAPTTSHNLMASLLALVLPLIQFEAVEKPCRGALCALSNTVSDRLRSIAMDISTCLYGLQRDQRVDGLVSSIILGLKKQIPPALSAEDFQLISPIIRAALLHDPSAEAGFTSGRRTSTKRRDAVSLVKTAAQVLMEHCTPEAVDAAVAASAVKAGSWAVCVLEREDGAFAAAADALALLTGTALNPGSASLAQVLEGIFSGKSSVRDATLAALARLPPLTSQNIGSPRDAALGRALMLCRFDPDDSNAEVADELWTNYGHPLFVSEDAPIILELLSHQESDIRVMSAKAIAHAVSGKENDSTRNVCIVEMFKTYVARLPCDEPAEVSGIRKGIPPPIKRGKDKGSKDAAGNALDEDMGWPAREGVALALENMALIKSLTPTDITVSFPFLAGRGLGDPNDTVRARMAKAASAVVSSAEALGPSVLLPMIEKQLNTSSTPSMTPEEILHADRTRENLVMCLGAVAGYLPPEDPRVVDIADQVIKSAMETPSEVVQNAAARCLVPLATGAIKGEREVEVAKHLLATLRDQRSSYGQRRGAAYAFAGVCGGLGLRFVKRAMLMAEIDSACAEKSASRKQGAFLLIETCAILMGRLFEPYVVTFVPFLLSCMSDAALDVRNACWAAAQAAMSELSSQGVKLVLPSLVEGLKDRQWRTRAGSAEVLGAMAFCAPRQLAQCLPQVVPKLAESLADAHPSVVDSAESAINRIAAVVRSPEVRKLSPFLLAALRDPAGRTRGAVDAMLGSEFVHAIDAASLALLIPPLHRGLRDRSSELKKRSAAIVGSMCNNVSNQSDVVPYLGLLLPALRVTLLDAIPDVRRTSARALGALSVSLGEKGLQDVVPWLIGAILGGTRFGDVPGEQSDIQPAVISSSAERAGAAMGLAEVSASMSERRLEDVLNRVLRAGLNSSESREGGLMLIAAMPRALGERFEGRIEIALAAILRGLADDADSVRESALEAGRNLVSAYAKTSLERLLPEMLKAMREKLWRIRQAATRLLGDMLLVVAGARPDRPDIFGAADSAGNDTELNEDGEDEDGGEDGEGEDGDDTDEEFESPEDAAAAMTVETAMKAIEEVLGTQRRNEVLAALYIARCDVSIRVRQTAMQVWKSVVSNTPRVLREIMPSAVRQIVDALGDEDEERRGAAGKTLGDLAQKLGDRVVPEVLPALRSGITSKENSDRIRKGACEGLGELVFACPKQQLEAYAEDFIDAVYQGLSDEVMAVRRIAADVFSSLMKPLGTFAVDSIIPRLIKVFSGDDVGSSSTEIALDGLKQVMRSSGTRLTAIVVPRLLEEKPLNAATAKVLATAAIVAESSFEPYIAEVTDSLVDSMEALASLKDQEPLEGVLAAIGECGDTCSKIFINGVVTKFNDGYPDRRIAASRVFTAFCRAANADRVAIHAVTLLEVLIRQLADTDEEAAAGAWAALKELSDSVGSAKLSHHIPVIRQSLRAAASGVTGTETKLILLGLQVPKSPAPFVPIVSEGLLQGTPELKEQAALCISELVELTNSKSLAPFVIKLTGPLIRSLSGRVPWQVKAAILKALLGLIKNGSVVMRSFVPQLQSSFVKSLSDGNRLVRVRACAGLAGILPLQNRLEPLLNDLVGLAINGPSGGSRSAAFRACSQVFRLGKKLPDSCFSNIANNLCEGLFDEDQDVCKTAGKSLGFLATRCSDSGEYAQVLGMVRDKLDLEEIEMTERISVIHALGALYFAGRDLGFVTLEDIVTSIDDVVRAIDSTIAQVQCAGCGCAGQLVMLLWSMMKGDGFNLIHERWREIVVRLADIAETDRTGDVRIAGLDGLKEILEVDEEALGICAECLVCGIGATNTGIREQAERTLRKAFWQGGKDGYINKSRLSFAKQMLNEEDALFLERKVLKLTHSADSGDEKE